MPHLRAGHHHHHSNIPKGSNDDDEQNNSLEEFSDKEQEEMKQIEETSRKQTKRKKSTTSTKPKKEKNENPQTSLSPREAFKKRDSEASKLAHNKKLEEASNPSPSEQHSSAGFYIKSVVFGGLDGILEMFAVMNGIVGSGHCTAYVIVLGFASLIADGLTMALGDFLSERAEIQFEEKERSREQWEIDNYLEGEKKEMVDLFTERGLPKQRARKIVNLMASNRQAFLDIMMVEELGILPHDPNEAPWKSALVTLISFILFGAIPLVVYIVGLSITLEHNEPANSANGYKVWGVACAFVLVTLFGLGAIQSRFSHQPWWRTGSYVMITGAISAAISFGVGYGLSELVGPIDG